MKDQIIELLASGFSKEDVAKTIGCSIALIDETLQEPEALKSLTAKAKELQEDRVVKRYSDLEEAVLKEIHKEVKSGMVDIPSMCRVLETVNKNKIANKQPAGHFTNPTAHLSVTLVLPNPAQAEKVIVDDKNQVVAIGNRNMAALPAMAVKKLFDKFAKGEDNTVTDDDLLTTDERNEYHGFQVAAANIA